MIITQKMENPVDHQKKNLGLYLPFLFPRLAGGSIERNDYIAQ